MYVYKSAALALFKNAVQTVKVTEKSLKKVAEN